MGERECSDVNRAWMRGRVWERCLRTVSDEACSNQHAKTRDVSQAPRDNFNKVRGITPRDPAWQHLHCGGYARYRSKSVTHQLQTLDEVVAVDIELNTCIVPRTNRG